MKLNYSKAVMRVLAGCKDGPCPKIIEGDDGGFVVQGPNLPEFEGVPAHERAVYIPREVMMEAVTALREGA
jgi:hypothetical protein